MLKAEEEMQGMLESVRRVSDALDTQEEMRNVRVSLYNLGMVLAGIAAAEQNRRFSGEDGGRVSSAKIHSSRNLHRSRLRRAPPAPSLRPK